MNQQHQDGNRQATLDLLTKGWAGFFAGSGYIALLAALPAWLPQQRWFGAKSRRIASVSVEHWVEITPETRGILPAAFTPTASTLGDTILFVDLLYEDSTQDRYQLPLGFASGAEAARVQAEFPGSVVLQLDGPTGPAVMHDACIREEFRQALLHLIQSSGVLAVHTRSQAAHEVAETIVAAHEGRPLHELDSASLATISGVERTILASHQIEPRLAAPEWIGHMPGEQAPASTQMLGIDTSSVSLQRLSVQGRPTQALQQNAHPSASRLGSAEQSNTNFVFGDTLLMKLFRRLQPGKNPDVEIGLFLTEQVRFGGIAPLLGEITLQGVESTTLAMLQPLVGNQGDGWQWTLDRLAEFFADASADLESARRSPHLESYRQTAALLGRRTAEMHRALATPTSDTAFSAEPLTESELQVDARRIGDQLARTMDTLQQKAETLPPELAPRAHVLLQRRTVFEGHARAVATLPPGGERIRIHGDFHLGQILRTADDFIILDFEGEPARTLLQRRQKQCPLKDVAGMLRSFSYATATGLNAARQAHPEQAGLLASCASIWQTEVTQGFLAGYHEAMAVQSELLPSVQTAEALLDGYLLEKALYELLYELNNRPDWVAIPLEGILALPQ